MGSWDKFNGVLVTVARDIFAAYIAEVAEGSKPQHHKFIVKGIEMTKRGNMDMPFKEFNVSLKGTLRGN